MILFIDSGEMYLKAKECDKALVHLDKALECVKMAMQEDHPFLGVVYQNIGAAELLKGNIDLSIINLEKSL